MAARALAARAGSSVVLSSVVAPGAVRAVALRQPTSLGALQMGSRRMVSGNSGPATVYQTFFKSNRMYITFVVCGAIVLTGVGNAVLDGVWAAKNRGRTFDTVDWSKFEKVTDDDDEDEDDDDDEEEDDDE